jgi:hypothetical protein
VRTVHRLQQDGRRRRAVAILPVGRDAGRVHAW